MSSTFVHEDSHQVNLLKRKILYYKMTNFVTLILLTTLLVLMFEFPFRSAAIEIDLSEIRTLDDESPVEERVGRQLWSFLPSPQLFVAETPSILQFEVARESLTDEREIPPLPMARGIIGQPEVVETGDSLMLSETDLFSKFTRALDTTNAEPQTEKRLTGESEPVERSATDIYAGKPRVRSIVSYEDAFLGESRSTDGDLEFVESSHVLPRHSLSTYYHEDDELFTPPIRRDGYGSNKVLKPTDCCLFVFLDGSAHFFDDFLRKLTGYYRLMYGTVNNHPHYVSRNCKNPEEYNGSCTYIWYSGYGWVVGVGRYIGQTKGVIYTRQEDTCPSGLGGWRYLNEDLEWKENGNIYLECAS